MRKSGVITESDDASSAKCASIAPVFMLSIRLCRFCDGVTDTVVPGQTLNSPPLDSLTIAVSGPAVIDDPDPASFLTSASGPAARTSATTGFCPAVKLGVPAGSNGELFAATAARPRCTTSRFPAASHVYVRG